MSKHKAKYVMCSYFSMTHTEMNYVHIYILPIASEVGMIEPAKITIQGPQVWYLRLSVHCLSCTNAHFFERSLPPSPATSIFCPVVLPDKRMKFNLTARASMWPGTKQRVDDFFDFDQKYGFKKLGIPHIGWLCKKYGPKKGGRGRVWHNTNFSTKCNNAEFVELLS